MDKQKVKDKDNNNDNITYCSKCLKQIDINDKDVVRDINGDWFCSSDCRKDFWHQARQDFDDIRSEFWSQ